MRAKVTRLRERLGITNASDNEEDKATPGKEGDAETGKDSKAVADSEKQDSNDVTAKKTK